MKHFLLAAGIALLCAGESGSQQLNAQTLTPYSKNGDTLYWMFRISEDNDFINARGRGTDNAYTNGTRLDYFFQRKHPSKNPINRFLPKAGRNSVDIYGWGVLQLMYTPDRITDSAYQPNDYPWSGALVATRTLYSYNSAKKYDFQTELELGVIGPAAMARQVQTGVHHFIHYLKPLGWGHQYSNDFLANINLTAERQLAGNGSNIEFIGGSQLATGTMMNRLTIYPLLRVGRMNPYFEGFFRQFAGRGRNRRHHKDWQLYFICRPELQFIVTEAVLQGGIFTRNPNMILDTNAEKPQQAPPKVPQPYHPIKNLVCASNFGVVASVGDFSLSFNQNSSTALMKGLYAHEYGNISLQFGW